MNSSNNSNTVCAQLTAPGRGAVAVIGVSGPASEKAIEKSFRPFGGRNYSSTSERNIVYGVWRSSNEDLILVRRGLERFEVHCHGGSMASAAILESLNKCGVTTIAPIDFANLFASNWLTSTQVALAESTTARTAKHLLQQTLLLPQAIENIESLIEKCDFEQAESRILQMLIWSEFGLHLTKPRSIVFCGRPNVGKSSIVNSIVGFQRAIVHDTPGTTRDVVSQSTAIDGWPVELRDTAGLRDSNGLIESKGIEKAKYEIENADLKICVFDGSKEWTDEDEMILDSVRPNLVVVNKIDLAQAGSTSSTRLEEVLVTSTASGQGIADLTERIALELAPQLPGPKQAFPVTTEQSAKLRELLQQTEA